MSFEAKMEQGTHPAILPHKYWSLIPLNQNGKQHLQAKI